MSLSASFAKLAAGLDDDVLASEEYPDQRPLSSLQILVLYASDTGVAKGLAEYLATTLSSENLGASVTLKSCSACFVDEAVTYNHLVIVASTIDGEPPALCANFVEELLSVKICSNDLKFAVFGCGDSSYDEYNTVAKNIDSYLGKIASRMTDIGLGDDMDGHDIHTTFTKWERSLLRVLLDDFGCDTADYDLDVSSDESDLDSAPQLPPSPSPSSSFAPSYSELVVKFIDSLPPTYTQIDPSFKLAGTFSSIVGDKPWHKPQKAIIEEAYRVMEMADIDVKNLAQFPVRMSEISDSSTLPILSLSLASKKWVNARKSIDDAVKRWIGRHGQNHDKNINGPRSRPRSRSKHAEVQSWWFRFLACWIEHPVTVNSEIFKCECREDKEDEDTILVLATLLKALCECECTITVAVSLTSEYETFFKTLRSPYIKNNVNGINLSNICIAVRLMSPPRTPGQIMWNVLEIASEASMDNGNNNNIVFVNESVISSSDSDGDVDIVMLNQGKNAVAISSSVTYAPFSFSLMLDDGDGALHDDIGIDMAVRIATESLNHAGFSPQIYTSDDLDHLVSPILLGVERSQNQNSGFGFSEHGSIFISIDISNTSTSPLSSLREARHLIDAAGDRARSIRSELKKKKNMKSNVHASCHLSLAASETPIRSCGDILSLIREQFCNGILSLSVNFVHPSKSTVENLNDEQQAPKTPTATNRLARPSTHMHIQSKDNVMSTSSHKGRGRGIGRGKVVPRSAPRRVQADRGRSDASASNASGNEFGNLISNLL